MLTAGRRGHLAAPRSPRLARRRAELLPRQAVGVLSAGRGPDRRQRRQRSAPRAGRPARAAGGVGARCRRPGRHLDGAAGPARRPQPAQRADRPAVPARARYRGGVQRRGAACRGPRIPAPGPPAPGDRRGRRGHFRGRQPVHQRAAHARRAGCVSRAAGGLDRGRPRPRHRLRAARRGPARPHRPDPGADAARQRAPDPRRDRVGRPRGRLGGAPSGLIWPRGGGGLPQPGGGGRPRIRLGPPETVSCCCRPPRRASASSGTTGNAARPSPARCRAARPRSPPSQFFAAELPRQDGPPAWLHVVVT